MHHTLRDGKPLSRCKLDRPAFQVNHETALHDVEELVFLIVLVLVELSLHDAEPDDAVIHPAQRLVIPGVRAGIDDLLNVDKLKRSIPRIQVDGVEFLSVHGSLLYLIDRFGR